MFVLKVETEDGCRFRVFRRRRDALARLRLEDPEAGSIRLFQVPDAAQAEVAVMAVRDGRGVPVTERRPVATAMLASMGLGTGLRA